MWSGPGTETFHATVTADDVGRDASRRGEEMAGGVLCRATGSRVTGKATKLKVTMSEREQRDTGEAGGDKRMRCPESQFS